MIGARLTDPLQSEDPNDRRVPVIVQQIMAEYEDQIVIPSMAEIRQKLGLK